MCVHAGVPIYQASIKLLAWEKPCKKELERLRRCEMKHLKLAAQLKSATLVLSYSMPTVATIVTVAVYTTR